MYGNKYVQMSEQIPIQIHQQIRTRAHARNLQIPPITGVKGASIETRTPLKE